MPRRLLGEGLWAGSEGCVEKQKENVYKKRVPYFAGAMRFRLGVAIHKRGHVFFTGDTFFLHIFFLLSYTTLTTCPKTLPQKPSRHSLVKELEDPDEPLERFCFLPR